MLGNLGGDAVTILLFYYRSGQRFFNGPATSDSRRNRIALESEPLCPGAQAHGFAIVGQQAIRPHITGLFQPRRPHAVFRGIRAVVVNTLDARLRKRFRSHVGQKVDKGLPPAITDRDAAGSMTPVAVGLRVIASGFHARPSPVFRRAVQASGQVTSAAARPGVAATKHCPADISVPAALATAVPASGVATNADELNNRQFPVDFASFVFHVLRQLSRIARSHLNFLSKFMVVRAAQNLRDSGRLVYYTR